MMKIGTAPLSLSQLYASEPTSTKATSTTSVPKTPLALRRPVQWPQEKERIRAALSSISSADRDTWFRNFGGAIHDETGGSPDGFKTGVGAYTRADGCQEL